MKQKSVDCAIQRSFPSCQVDESIVLLPPITKSPSEKDPTFPLPPLQNSGASDEIVRSNDSTLFSFKRLSLGFPFSKSSESTREPTESQLLERVNESAIAARSAQEAETLQSLDEMQFHWSGGSERSSEPLSSMELITSSMERFKSVQSIRQTTEATLRLLLRHSQGTHLCYVRQNEDQLLVVDGSLTMDSTRSILEGTSTDQSSLFPQNLLKTCQTSQDCSYFPSEAEVAICSPRAEGRAGDLQLPMESVLLVPVVLNGQFLGAACFSHSNRAHAFEHVDRASMAMILTTLTCLLNNATTHSPTNKISAVHKPSAGDLPCLRKVKKPILQDTMLMCDPSHLKWLKVYAVAGDNQIQFFQTAWDTHPRQIVKISSIRSVKMAPVEVSNNPNNVSRAKSLKDFRNLKASIPDEWKPPNASKLSKTEVIVFIKCRNPSPSQWIALNSLKAAQEWIGTVTEMMKSLENHEEDYLRIPINIRIRPKEVVKREILGRGAAATVFSGRWNQTPVAIKQLLDTHNDDEEATFFQEMEVLQNLRHPHIVQLFGGFISDDGRPSIVFELMTRGSLTDALYDSTTPLSYSLKLRILQQLAQALDYLHELTPPIIHRDLKPANVLVSLIAITESNY